MIIATDAGPQLLWPFSDRPRQGAGHVPFSQSPVPFVWPNIWVIDGTGQGPGLTPRGLGETFGESAVTLTGNQIPSHAHAVNAYSQTAAGSGSHTPVANGGLSFLAGSTAARTFTTPANTSMAAGMIAPTTGGGAPHENQQPYLGVNFCIALQGVFPSFP